MVFFDKWNVGISILIEQVQRALLGQQVQRAQQVLLAGLFSPNGGNATTIDSCVPVSPQ
jgi:hypothetical protein